MLAKEKTTPLTKNVREAKENQVPTINTLPGFFFFFFMCDSSSIQSISINPRSARVAPKRERMPDTG
jgi:hypothetical protein